MAGRRVEAIRAARNLVGLLGVTRTLPTVNPVITDLLALIGLLDENPANDSFAWVTLAGGIPKAEPFMGLPSALIQYLNPGPGRAERAEPDAILARVLTRPRNDVASYIDDIAALGITAPRCCAASSAPTAPSATYCCCRGRVSGGSRTAPRRMSSARSTPSCTRTRPARAPSNNCCALSHKSHQPCGLPRTMRP
ncbi:hypothetical protein [Streptomyces sp. NBC_01236]|uniref:hypothetical protein n=1 Tax=Streptomyces sp. NBC_01236 TaxID=2903789 RepID=UPI002E14AC99|nr:hypothetical protein OG324_41330 [Streptomyces sp. NBC_01236]